MYNYTNNRHAGTPNKTKTGDTIISLDYSSTCCIALRIGRVSMKRIYKVKNVDVMILENCPITNVVHGTFNMLTSYQ